LLYLNSFIRVRKQSPVLGIAFPHDRDCLIDRSFCLFGSWFLRTLAV
jgi:hypothetical protein